jgi:hypothetical protein
MPHKHNAARRHHIGKMKFKLTNWAEYEAGLRRRGSMTLWVTPEALDGWAAPRRKTRGGQPRYSDLAIETTLTLGMVFGLRLRQSEGLLSSVLDMMRLDLPVPDHTTLSRRARTWKPSARSNDRQPVARGPLYILVDSTGLKIYGAGQWLEEKHGTKSRRGWRKLRLAVDADSGEIIAHSLTNQETSDASQLGPLLDQIDDERLCCKFLIWRRKNHFGSAIRRLLPERGTAQRAMDLGCRKICLVACASFEPSRYRQALLSHLKMP